MSDPKAVLRAQLREEYSSLTNHYKIDADRALVNLVSEFPLYQSAERIFLFASTKNEVNTHDLIRDAFSRGKHVYLPKCHANGHMEFYEYDGSLTVGRFGILEPTGTQSESPRANDLIIVPGLAFTPAGLRLGQGGGYYDRYLEKFPCITVGLCRNRFIRKDLPVAWNDLPMHYVITETTVYTCKNGAS